MQGIHAAVHEAQSLSCPGNVHFLNSDILRQAMMAAAAEEEAVPRSYSSLDEALVQRMAATRLTPQLLAVLMGNADQVRKSASTISGSRTPSVVACTLPCVFIRSRLVVALSTEVACDEIPFNCKPLAS